MDIFDNRLRFTLLNATVALLSINLLICITQASNPDLETDKTFQSTWTEQINKNNKSETLRYDFLFNLHGKINGSTTSQCNGHSACLLLDGKFDRVYELNTTATEKGKHESIFQSARGVVHVTHYCNTHWNPPIHLYKNNEHHSIEWHSPILCPAHALTYERPCYVYDPKGKLIDLTTWVASDGDSYEVDLSQTKSNDIHAFHLNICNEAHNQCGPNVAACFDNPDGRTESGYLNLTTIKYDTETKNVLVTSLGQHNGTCPEKAVKTVVKFVCNNRPGQKTGPRLVQSSSCEHVVEWKTIHACPVAEARVPATSCSIKYEPLNINLNLKELTNATSFEIPDVEYNGKKHKVLVSLCNGIKPTTFACEGKKSSQTSACLIETPDSTTSAKNSSKLNSTVIGSITQSSIQLTDDRLHLELLAVNKTCLSEVVGKNFTNSRLLGTRVEFFCSPLDRVKPTYLGFDDCTFVFQWGLRGMCLETFGGSITHANSAPLSEQNPVHPGDKEPKLIDLEPKKKTALELHDATHKDSVKMMEQDSSKATPRPADSTTVSSKSSTTSTSNEAPQVFKKKIEPAMNTYHKYFMISLIIMMLGGFIVVILVLDRRTRIRSPMGSLRRRVHQVFQPAPVPYTQVDRFNDSLDL